MLSHNYRKAGNGPKAQQKQSAGDRMEEGQVKLKVEYVEMGWTVYNFIIRYSIL